MIRSVARFFAVAVALILVVGWVLSLVWSAPVERDAVLASGVVALVTQLFAFAAVRLAPRENVMAGWGIGVLLRFVVLVGWGFVAPRAFGLPLAPALMSLAAYLFVTSIAEPVLLKA
jgi:hypothetical protein